MRFNNKPANEFSLFNRMAGSSSVYGEARRTKNRLAVPQSHIVHPNMGHQRFFPFPPTNVRKRTGVKASASRFNVHVIMITLHILHFCIGQKRSIIFFSWEKAFRKGKKTLECVPLLLKKLRVIGFKLNFIFNFSLKIQHFIRHFSTFHKLDNIIGLEKLSAVGKYVSSY